MAKGSTDDGTLTRAARASSTRGETLSLSIGQGNAELASFDTSVKGVWRFDKILTDDVAQANFTATRGSAKFKQFDKFDLLSNSTISRSGLEFEESKRYTATADFTYDNDFTISFWYFSPGLVGFTRNFVTRELEPKVAPIFAKANSVKSSTSTILSRASFVITEVGDSKTKNAIRVYLSNNAVDVSHIITSEAFSPGLRLVLMTYDKSSGRFRIDIDGKSGILHAAPRSSLDQTGLLRINDIAPGFLAHKTEQVGAYIFDLVFTTYVASDNESLKAFRYGYEHITFDNLFDTRFSYFGLSYAQPTTVSTTHVFVDGGNIFAARSNGKIMKGDKPIWDKEFAYPDADSIKDLDVSQVDEASDTPVLSDRVAEWTPTGLRLKGTTVTI